MGRFFQHKIQSQGTRQLERDRGYARIEKILNKDLSRTHTDFLNFNLVTEKGKKPFDMTDLTNLSNALKKALEDDHKVLQAASINKIAPNQLAWLRKTFTKEYVDHFENHINRAKKQRDERKQELEKIRHELGRIPNLKLIDKRIAVIRAAGGDPAKIDELKETRAKAKDLIELYNEKHKQFFSFRRKS